MLLLFFWAASKKKIKGAFLGLRQFLATVNPLKVVSATFLPVCFIFLKDSNCETRKNVFYFTSKALFVFETIKF